MTLHLEVYGRAWGGFRAFYSYTIPEATPISSIEANPERFAGDFEQVLDWRLVQETNAYERTSSQPITRRIDTFRTLRGFRNGMTPLRFYHHANRG